MARKKFTDEQKAAFMTAVHGYMDKGWSAGSAYKQVAAEYQQEGKEVPEKSHFYRWLAREKRESGGEGADAANRPTDPAAEPEEAEAADLSDGSDQSDGSDGAGTEAPDPDYTRRLEMMVRLYRTRSEAAVDAVCDRLLPELAEEE